MTFPLRTVTHLPTLAHEEQPRAGGQRRPSVGRGRAQHKVSALGARGGQDSSENCPQDAAAPAPGDPRKLRSGAHGRQEGVGRGAAGAMPVMSLPTRG